MPEAALPSLNIRPSSESLLPVTSRRLTRSGPRSPPRPSNPWHEAQTDSNVFFASALFGVCWSCCAISRDTIAALRTITTLHFAQAVSSQLKFTLSCKYPSLSGFPCPEIEALAPPRGPDLARELRRYSNYT